MLRQRCAGERASGKPPVPQHHRACSGAEAAGWCEAEPRWRALVWVCLWSTARLLTQCCVTAEAREVAAAADTMFAQCW
jgi:hypothetical protein